MRKKKETKEKDLVIFCILVFFGCKGYLNPSLSKWKFAEII